MENTYGQNYGLSMNGDMNQNQNFGGYGQIQADTNLDSSFANNSSADFNFGNNQTQNYNNMNDLNNMQQEKNDYQWNNQTQNVQVAQPIQTQNYNNMNNGYYCEDNRKDAFVAGVFALFFGVYGIHNFYLGNNKKAWWQLGLTLGGMLTSCIFIGFALIIAASVWSIIDAISLFTGSITTDANGIPLKR